jgi:hypothetical protein
MIADESENLTDSELLDGVDEEFSASGHSER